MDELSAAVASQLEETDTPGSPLETGHRILQRVIQFVAEHGCQYRDQAEPAVRQLYDKYVRPLDIPGVPNLVVEPRVDDAIEEVIVRLLNRALDNLCDQPSVTAGE